MSATVKRFRKSGRRLEALLAGHFSVLEWPPLSYYQRSLTSCRQRHNTIRSHSNGNLITPHGRSYRSSWSGGFNFDQMPKGNAEYLCRNFGFNWIYLLLHVQGDQTERKNRNDRCQCILCCFSLLPTT